MGIPASQGKGDIVDSAGQQGYVMNSPQATGAAGAAGAAAAAGASYDHRPLPAVPPSNDPRELYVEFDTDQS